MFAKPNQLEQQTIDRLYQAQLWLQAEDFLIHVSVMMVYLQVMRLLGWHDVGDTAIGVHAGFLAVKAALLARCIKPNDNLEASPRAELQACSQNELSVEAHAFRFQGIAARIMVVTSLTRSLRPPVLSQSCRLNYNALNQSQGIVDHVVLRYIDTLTAAAINVKANLNPAGKQADNARRERFRHYGKSKGSDPGSALANTVQQKQGYSTAWKEA